MSPTWTSRAGLAGCRLDWSRPSSHAREASERVLKNRAAQSHLSMRTEGIEILSYKTRYQSARNVRACGTDFPCGTDIPLHGKTFSPFPYERGRFAFKVSPVKIPHDFEERLWHLDCIPSRQSHDAATDGIDEQLSMSPFVRKLARGLVLE